MSNKKLILTEAEEKIIKSLRKKKSKNEKIEFINGIILSDKNITKYFSDEDIQKFSNCIDNHVLGRIEKSISGFTKQIKTTELQASLSRSITNDRKTKFLDLGTLRLSNEAFFSEVYFINIYSPKDELTFIKKAKGIKFYASSRYCQNVGDYKIIGEMPTATCIKEIYQLGFSEEFTKPFKSDMLSGVPSIYKFNSIYVCSGLTPVQWIQQRQEAATRRIEFHKDNIIQDKNNLIQCKLEEKILKKLLKKSS